MALGHRPAAAGAPTCSGQPALQIRFDDAGHPLSDDEKTTISTILQQTATDVCRLLAGLPQDIRISVSSLDRNLDIVSGVIGSADAPGEVTFRLSSTHPGGVAGSARAGLRRVAFHEFHHLVTGWTLRAIFTEKSFGGGILTAAVYEGLADVFAFDYTGTAPHDSLAIPVNAEEWLTELSAIPDGGWKWEDWMNRHPDGRLAIGYRVGAYVVRRAMERSHKSIVELTSLPAGKILELADVRRTARP